MLVFVDFAALALTIRDLSEPYRCGLGRRMLFFSPLGANLRLYGGSP